MFCSFFHHGVNFADAISSLWQSPPSTLVSEDAFLDKTEIFIREEGKLFMLDVRERRAARDAGHPNREPQGNDQQEALGDKQQDAHVFLFFK
jgi:hypothetical protein